MEFNRIKLYLKQFTKEHILTVLGLEDGYNFDELTRKTIERLEDNQNFLDEFNPDV